VRHGTSSSISLGASCPSDCANGPTGSDQWDLVLSNQISELQAAGCAKVYSEKISGAKSDRRELTKCLKKLRSGDVLVVSRLDRLARSTRDLLNILDSLGKKGVSFKSLHDSWLDTSTAQGKLILTVLGGLAEFERSLIVARTGEGRKRALARGVRFGRPSKLNHHQRMEALSRVAAGEAQSDVARTFAVDPAVICRLVASQAG
jgi:DNA invertase Pin-like site-specific DNA recombinase